MLFWWLQSMLYGVSPPLFGSVQQATVFGVPEEELGQAATPPTDGDVEGRVSSLGKQEVQR